MAGVFAFLASPTPPVYPAGKGKTQFSLQKELISGGGIDGEGDGKFTANWMQPKQMKIVTNRQADVTDPQMHKSCSMERIWLVKNYY